MMDIKDAMTIYFNRLEDLYKTMFGTLPTVSWSEDYSQELFIGKPDEDNEIQWKAKEAEPIHKVKLCKELREFYGSYYYWELRGEYHGVLFAFPAVSSSKSAVRVASTAVSDGNYYFPNQEAALLATCSAHGNDDLILFYLQNKGELFIYDRDKGDVVPLDYSFVDLISSMKAVI